MLKSFDKWCWDNTILAILNVSPLKLYSKRTRRTSRGLSREALQRIETFMDFIIKRYGFTPWPCCSESWLTGTLNICWPQTLYLQKEIIMYALYDLVRTRDNENTWSNDNHSVNGNHQHYLSQPSTWGRLVSMSPLLSRSRSLSHVPDSTNAPKYVLSGRMDWWEPWSHMCGRRNTRAGNSLPSHPVTSSIRQVPSLW